MIYWKISACSKTVLSVMVDVSQEKCWMLFFYWDSESTLCWLVFPAIACFLCCRCSSAAIRVGWQGWFISAWVLCALPQPSLLCSAQRPSWPTLSEASSSPGIWRKEHEMLMCRTVLVCACSKGLYFFRKISMCPGFCREIELLVFWSVKQCAGSSDVYN